jgi:helicase-like protein/SNF2 domain-containing protein
LAWPRIVAESLRRVARVGDVMVPGPVSQSPAATAAVMRAAAAPGRSARVPPAILHPHQQDSWRRVVAALAGWGGALLLDPVGRGKSWIALAVAMSEAGGIVVIVPAILQAQWLDVAKRAGVDVTIWTHERCSRGSLPATSPSLVIVDEAHRFRDGGSQRTRTLAPWLVGRRTLLLTATPIVNRVGDLINLLRLALPEDALALDGIAALADLETMSTPPCALRRIAIRTAVPAAAMVDRSVVRLGADAAERARGDAAVAAIGQLSLSDSRPIRRLLTSVFLDAAASSDAALHQALRRYRALLLHSRDAGGATRAMLRQFAGESLEQLVLWPLLDVNAAGCELPSADIERVAALLRSRAADAGWVGALMARCSGEVPTVIFTRHRATAAMLREHLGDAVAWVTGGDAGVGPHRLPRAAVLAAFGPRRSSWQLYRAIPRILIATDVAAEGLDLQSAGRIIHVDIPWTATRLAQREGRLLRLGQSHAAVTVIIRSPSPAIERALAAHARVQRKGRLADRWIAVLEEADNIPSVPTMTPVVSILSARHPGSAFVTIQLSRGGRVGSVVIRRSAHGQWQQVAALPDLSALCELYDHSVEADCSDVAALLADATRFALASCAGHPRGSGPLIARIHQLARRAAAARDGRTLHHLDRLLRFATASTTTGARLILARLAESPDSALLRCDVADAAEAGPVRGRAVAALIFRSQRATLIDAEIRDGSL